MKKNRTITQNCNHCNEPYIPTRKGAQKFCSASCRSRHWFLKKQNKLKPKKELLDQSSEANQQKLQEIKEDKPNSVEKMSLPGVGNSFLGSLAAEVVTGVAKNAWKRDSDKPATKGDIEEVRKLIDKRYFRVFNVSPDSCGRKPYFDKITHKIVYFDEPQKRFILPLANL